MPRSFLLMPVLVAPCLFVALTHAQAEDPAGGPERVVDLDFAGGSAADYVAALRDAAGTVNVVFEPGLEKLPIASVQLRQVDVASAVELLDGLQHAVGENNWVLTKVHMTRQRSPRSLPIFRVHGKPSGPGATASPPPRPLATHVWSLAPMLARNEAPEDVLTAVETAIELHEGSAAPAQLRFHRETGLLLCRAEEDQLETIDRVIGELRRRRPDAAMEQRLNDVQQKADQELARLRAGLAEAEEIARTATTWQTRAELYHDEIRSLQKEAARLRERMTEELRARDARIHEMGLEYAALKRTLTGRQD